MFVFCPFFVLRWTVPTVTIAKYIKIASECENCKKNFEFLKKPVFSEILKILSKMRNIERKSVCYDICYYSFE